MSNTIDINNTHPLPVIRPAESSLIWKQGAGAGSTGSVLVILAQNGYTREAHRIIELSRTASLIGRDSDGGLPELWDVMGQVRGKNGVTRLMAVCLAGGSHSSSRAQALIREHNANIKEKDDLGQSALDIALGSEYFHERAVKHNNTNTDLVRLLVKLDPSTLDRSRDSLLRACSNGASLELIRFLHDTYPEPFDVNNQIIRLRLHRALETGASNEATKFLAEAYPECIKEKVIIQDFLYISLAIGKRRMRLSNFLSRVILKG